jgi:hypothetical protein
MWNLGGGGYLLSPGLLTENALRYGGFECPFIFSSLSLSEPGVPGRADIGYDYASPWDKPASPNPVLLLIIPYVAKPQQYLVTPHPFLRYSSSVFSNASPLISYVPKQLATPLPWLATPSNQLSTPPPYLAVPYPYLAMPHLWLATPQTNELRLTAA